MNLTLHQANRAQYWYWDSSERVDDWHALFRGKDGFKGGELFEQWIAREYAAGHPGVTKMIHLWLLSGEAHEKST